MTINERFISLQKVPATAKIFFLQNLSVMVKAGLPLANAIETLRIQTKNEKLKYILKSVSEEIKTGKALSECLTPHIRDFGEIFINMISAGESSGSLDSVLENLYLQTKKTHSLKTKIRNAMTYPTIIVMAMFGIGTFVIVYVLPNLTAMFTEMEAELPLPTKILIAISDFVQANGLILFPSLILSLMIFIKFISSGYGQKLWHNLIIKLPIIGEIIKKINTATIALNLSNLIQTDIALPEAIAITAKTLKHQGYRKALLETSEKIKKGQRIAEIFSEYPEIFSPIFLQMIAIGEETGSLDAVLKNLADFYQEEVEQTMETLPVIIEPLLMIIMGLGVAGLAMAVILPIYSLTQTI